MARISGFIGVESYDLIMYLAKVSRMLNSSVLLIDDSDDKSLQYTVPEPINTGYTEFESGIMFADSSQFLNEPFPNYDFIFIYFGKNVHSHLLASCDELLLVTDYQKHNIEFLKALELSEDYYLFLVIRDRLSSKITPEYIKYELEHLQIPNSAVIVLEDSENDLENKVRLQYNSVKMIKRPSVSIVEFIFAVLKEDFTEKEIKGALKSLRR